MKDPNDRVTAVGAVLLILGTLIMLTAVGFFYRAVWTHGPDSNRWGGTGVITLILGVITAGVGGFLLDEVDR